jgi:ribonuclease I
MTMKISSSIDTFGQGHFLRSPRAAGRVARLSCLMAALVSLHLAMADTAMAADDGASTAAGAAVTDRAGAAADTQPPLPQAGTGTKALSSRTGRTGFVLSLSWQPGFCETRSRRPECAGQTADRVDARQLSLVGLSPVRNSFCKVSEALQTEDRKRMWLALPAVPLGAEVAERLAVAMPGAASGLDRHQWLRSGSCQELGPDAYFALQIRLLDTINASDVGILFRERIGSEINEADVKAAFDRSFSAGAGERVRLQCRRSGDRVLVTGLTVGLAATLDPQSSLDELVQGAQPVRSRCAGGVLAAAGRKGQEGVSAASAGANRRADVLKIAAP